MLEEQEMFSFKMCCTYPEIEPEVVWLVANSLTCDEKLSKIFMIKLCVLLNRFAIFVLNEA